MGASLWERPTLADRTEPFKFREGPRPLPCRLHPPAMRLCSSFSAGRYAGVRFRSRAAKNLGRPDKRHARSSQNPNPAIGYWSGSERLMDGSFRGRRSSPAKGFGLPPTPDLIRGRKPQGWGGVPAGFARGAGPRRAMRRFVRLCLRIGGGSPWPSPSKRQCLPPVNPNHSRSHPHFNRGIWEKDRSLSRASDGHSRCRGQVSPRDGLCGLRSPRGQRRA